MPSSISNSEADRPARPHGGDRPIPGLRLTASDRPGMAQPVPERDIPARPWRPMLLVAAAITAALVGLWEVGIRQAGLRAGDFDDGGSAWAVQRRRVDAEQPRVVIVGDSRILFATNLDRFAALTGTRPIQLALPGTNGRPFLEDLADNSDFRGLVIVGITDSSYFRKGIGFIKDALEKARWEAPNQRISHLISRELEGHLAFIDADFRLSILIQKLDRGWRTGVEGPYDEIWKLSESGADRDTAMWSRIERPGFLQDQARAAWHGFEGSAIKEEVIALTLEKTKAAVDKIRARGGDVVFVRPPSAPEIRGNEDKRISREKGWDALLLHAAVKGIHADDQPGAAALRLPEYSHLSRRCALVYTDMYVRALTDLTPLLPLRPDAPPPLTPADCGQD